MIEHLSWNTVWIIEKREEQVLCADMGVSHLLRQLRGARNCAFKSRGRRGDDWSLTLVFRIHYLISPPV